MEFSCCQVVANEIKTAHEGGAGQGVKLGLECLGRLITPPLQTKCNAPRWVANEMDIGPEGRRGLNVQLGLERRPRSTQNCFLDFFIHGRWSPIRRT